MKLYPNEMVIKAADTTYLSNGSEGVRGKLVLTNQRIYFVPGSRTGQNLEIMPEDIEEVMQFNNRFIFPTGMNIITRQGSEIRFLVKQRNDWIGMIVRMC
ncbi:MAG: hypothetical protein JXA03_06590 [Bacteroidales bacterium]|nr:hypothetical protein [Bacteroidales bacterium]